MRESIELLEYAAEWAPFGGGDEWILPRFGLTLEEYSRRLLALMRTRAAVMLDGHTRSLIEEQCRRRLVHASPTPRSSSHIPLSHRG